MTRVDGLTHGVSRLLVSPRQRQDLSQVQHRLRGGIGMPRHYGLS